ncbi:MAG: hypothetical protein COW24_04510 [Candidatus Kerfeldbacteria bacterium CG15_BIG_FIL_POST_REV_8_21_14_020_45_12]|uniref:EamA domain-containing protein n=1 Tax=Candidatus Kerfeldbacteria bacterium CG15_BIG_FIL_POST_REV_8_21_14_020_45_12 TaxID=2014247 RepID=A0A2M7H2Y0_9BACT|nr:MAG: hypothetical protein COW24_04510 [Candidatus Kerfeldbacteria bacterium CG15_BIG_FIL_POST_REV_8_21_14_020_45_12]PJA93354.1 MAG: hypothetical protein CO132_03285 [Candidatus Kerfeldbacteria bacterium CG_4_9_14_3_um_filter_45_8]
MGILFALGAFFGWGIGDFLIQRCTRKGGVTLTFWIISAIGSAALLPFVINSETAFSEILSFPILLATGTTIMNGFFLFWLFKHINLSIVQPVISLELPLGVILAAILFHESILPQQWLLIFAIFLGVVMLSFALNPFKVGKIKLEKGILLTTLAAFVSTSMNLSTAAAVEQFDPWFVIWAVGALITLVLLPLVLQKRRVYFASLKENPILYFATSIIDVTAWISFSFGVVYLPISLVLGLSQGYVLVSVILGITFNKERLRSWQYLGLFVTMTALIMLAFTTQ